MTEPTYQPPAGAGPSGPRASFGRRLLAIIIDGILLAVVYGIFFAISRTIAYVVVIVLGLAYYTYFEGSGSGQTIGKKLLGIRVIDFSAGGPIGYERGFVRQLARSLSLFVCCLCDLWML